jgi:hypothetical protein
MGLIDWLRGTRPEPRDSQEERLDVSEGGAENPGAREPLDERIAEEHDEEALRHRGM